VKHWRISKRDPKGFPGESDEGSIGQLAYNAYSNPTETFRYLESKGVYKMEQKTETKGRVIKVVIWVVVIVALMGTMHILVNNFDILDALKSIHGQVRLQH
jgi:hypothetical protein